MRQTWSKLGGQLGLGLAAIGLLAIGIGWNGAAGLDFVSGQIPYLLSGAAFGLALVIIGVSLVVVQSNRRDRAMLEAHLSELNQSIARLANAVGVAGGTNGAATIAPGMVVVGATSYHRADCRLAQGKHLSAMPVAAAQAEGLEPCRICDPIDDADADADAEAEYAAEDRSGRRVRRRSRA